MSDEGLVAALARAQGKFPPIVKSHPNPAFKGSQYADVADVLEIVRPILAGEGLVLTQVTDVNDETGAVVLITKLMCGSEKLVSRFPLHIAGLTPQGIGSLMTYTKRYQACAILAVHPVGDDDDGNAAQTAPPQAQRAPLVKGDPYALAAENPPEKPLAAMTAGEMARYGESIGVRVTGSKADILRTLTPYVKAATGEEPFDLPGDGQSGTDLVDADNAYVEPERPPFTPTTFDDEMKMKPPAVRRSITRRGGDS